MDNFGFIEYIDLFPVNWLHMLNKKIRFTFPGGQLKCPLAHMPAGAHALERTII